MTTITDNNRSATITAGGCVIFCNVHSDGTNAPCHHKPSRHYTTSTGAIRAAGRWVKYGK